MQQEGRNAGVTGVVDFPGQAAKFEVWARGHDTTLSAGLINAAGRGDTEWPENWPGSSSGFVSIGADVRFDGWPLPDRFRGERGTLTITLTTGKTLTYTVRVTKERLVKSDKAAGVWTLTLVCELVAAPVAAGFGGGAQPASAVEALGDKQTWEGMSKTVDPHGLQSAATARILTWGIGDNDAAEKAKLDAVLGAIADPFAGMKPRTAAFTRLSTHASLVNVTWGLTDTAEDVINENSQVDVDPAHLQSTATTAAINGTPPTPDGGETWAERATRTQELNDDNILYVTTWGLTTTKQDVEYEGSEVRDDPVDLDDETEIALVQTSATPSAPSTPSGLKLVAGPLTKQLTPARWRHTWRYGRRDGKDTIEQEGTYADTDVSDLTSEGRQTTVFTTLSGQPADPSPPAGLQIVGRRVTVRNNVKSVKVWSFAKDTPAQKAVQERTWTDTDPSGIRTEKSAAAIDASPATPSGTVLRSTRVDYLTNDHTRTTKVGGQTTFGDDLTFPRTRYETDNAGLSQDDEVAVIFTTGGSPSAPTPPDGMVIAGFYDAPVTNPAASNLSVRVYRMAYVTNAQRLELPHFESLTDPNDLDTRKRTAAVWDATGSAPADPAAPSGLKLVDTRDLGVATTAVYQVRVYTWAKNDSADALILPHSWTVVDADDLASEGETAALDATPPAAPSGYYDRGIVGRYQTGDHVLNVRRLGKRSPKDDVEMPGTVSRSESFRAGRLRTTTVVPNSIDDVATVAASYFAIFKDDTTFESVEVERLNRDNLRVTLETRDDEIIVDYSLRPTGRLLVPAYLDSGDVYVFLRQKIKIGTSLWQYELAEQYLYGARMRIGVTRRVSGTSVNLSAGLLNTSNNATFLGLPAGTITYMGLDGATNISVAGARVSDETYGFEYDSLGIIELADASMGWLWTTTDLTSVTPGWVTASSLGLSSGAVGGADYSGFVT